MRIGGFLAACLVWIAVPSVMADVAPASPEELRQRATLIVEGVIEGLRIGREPSEFEPGIGNSDWGIYLTLRVDRVLKAQAPAGPLVARCFRVRQRRSLWESLTPSGHHPIPGVGARVTAHLNGEDDAWRVVLPNGIRVLDGRRAGNTRPAFGGIYLVAARGVVGGGWVDRRGAGAGLSGDPKAQEVAERWRDGVAGLTWRGKGKRVSSPLAGPLPTMHLPGQMGVV